jgi:hypothetical protein
LRISDHELAWLALPLFSSVAYGNFSNSRHAVYLPVSSRVNLAMRGSSISFLTRASVAWLASCFGSRRRTLDHVLLAWKSWMTISHAVD